MSQGIRFNLSGLFIIVGMCAVVLGLGNWIGLVIAIPIAALPFSLIVERMLRPSLDQDADDPAGFNIMRVSVVIVCALSTALVAWYSVSDGVPTLAAPLPFLVIVPMFYELPGMVVLAIPVLTFVVLNLRTAGSCSASLPLRFPLLLGIATILSVIEFSLGWRYGLEYQGPHYTLWITVINSLWILGLWSFWWLSPHRSSFCRALPSEPCFTTGYFGSHFLI